jgi:hypothetical protein
MKVGNGASEIGGGVGPNNATSPMNEPFFGGSQIIYTFPGCYSGDLNSRKSLTGVRRLPQQNISSCPQNIGYLLSIFRLEDVFYDVSL